MDTGGLTHSVRRYYVDRFYEQRVPALPAKSRVLDLGGQKYNKRGNFDIGACGLSVTYANLVTDKGTDVACDAKSLPFPDGSFDAVICSELLEHVPAPAPVIAECRRVLKPGGTLLVTVPFLFRIHGDPEDYGRYTDSYWQKTMNEAGFTIKEIEKHGHYASVLAEFIRAGLQRKTEGKTRLDSLRRRIAAPIGCWLKNRAIKKDAQPFTDPYWASYTTGFGIIAEKTDG